MRDVVEKKSKVKAGISLLDERSMYIRGLYFDFDPRNRKSKSIAHTGGTLWRRWGVTRYNVKSSNIMNNLFRGIAFFTIFVQGSPKTLGDYCVCVCIIKRLWASNKHLSKINTGGTSET